MLLVQEFTSNSIFLRPTYVYTLGQQNTTIYGLTLHRKILLFNLYSITVRWISLNCFPDSAVQTNEKRLPLNTPRPEQPEQDITSLAPTTSNYQNSLQEVTFYFSLMPQIVILWSPQMSLYQPFSNLPSKEMLHWLSWNMASPIYIPNSQVQLQPRSDIKWMDLSLQSDGYRLAG
jgi:hypothetical protein